MICSLISIYSFILLSFHSLQFQDVDGNTISMGAYEDKKVLLVNIATGSDKVDQLRELQQLQEQYADSLVIIAFPSNSFGNEPMTNSQIEQFCQTNYNSSFIIASKGQVAGTPLQSVYDWLSKTSDNDQVDLMIGGDFQKVLINKDGTIKGIFSPKLNPLHPKIIEAITSIN